jgi:hypothetical protein
VPLVSIEQHFLYFLPLLQGQGSLRPSFGFNVMMIFLKHPQGCGKLFTACFGWPAPLVFGHNGLLNI